MDRRSHFLSALIGGLVAAVLMAALPALAGDGDYLVLGQKNSAAHTTKLNAKRGLTLRSGKAGNPALYIETEPGTPPMRVNRAAWVENLHADLLDGFQGNEMIRVAYAATTDVDEAVFGGGASGTLLSASITAPTAGFLVIMAAGDFFGATDDRYYCELTVDGTGVLGSRMWGTVGNTGEQMETPCTTSGTSAVTSGPHTVAFRGHDRSTYAIDDASLSVIFIPFGATGDLGG